MGRYWRVVALAAIAAGGVGLASELRPWHPEAALLQATTLDEFERRLAALREPLTIPGMSAAIARADRVIWSRGFGVADGERTVMADADTLYHLASVTKPYAATVVLQLADEGRLRLSDVAPGVASNAPEPVRIWHLLSHTSMDTPGTRFHYDGGRYGLLTQVVENVTGRSFSAELTDRIIRKLGLTSTAPNPHDVSAAPADDPARRAFDDSGLDRADIDRRLATGYCRPWFVGPLRPMEHLTYLFASAGLVASSPDVARFSMALDRGELLQPATRDRMFSPTALAGGDLAPYGLGWFVQTINGERVVWHFGQADESSSLVVKIPARALTFVVLANSDGLSRLRKLGNYADLRRSPVALLFLNYAPAATTAFSSSCALSSDRPGARRPIAIRPRRSRGSSAASVARGTQTF